MTPRTLSRIALVMALAIALVTATALVLPAPLHIVAALLTLPVGASLFASATPS